MSARVRQRTALFDRTVYLCINAVIEIHGARATVRGAQLSIHVLADDSESAFLAAGHTDAALIRTADGCSISASPSAAQDCAIMSAVHRVSLCAGGGSTVPAPRRSARGARRARLPW
ncbi:nuclear transport factor 2 family protein [Streptomyces similanensis]|uniref:nuclear transport factor 2 family protein n=1 Tax=Streptomyces similanensis TaxID=1274988 RepID=UPI003CD06DB7